MANFEVLLIVYFLYGLSFFSMGLILILESTRTSSLELIRLLRPLSIFGLLHGIHEWFEIFLIQARIIQVNLPAWMSWIQLVVLTASFVALAVYGMQAFRTLRNYFTPLAYFGMVTLPIYALLVGADVMWAYANENISAYSLMATLVRYLLAVPSAALATIGLNAASTRAFATRRIPLNVFLKWASIGFAAYSVTQLFVSPIPAVFASAVNTESFQALTGIPIQAVRTVTGIIITISMFGSANFLEKERQDEQRAVQKMRMELLERQEQLGRELLRNTIRAQEEERARIARELHDELAQTLTAFTLDIGTLQNALPRENGTHVILDRLQNLSRQMSQSMIHMVYSLRPPHLDELGLVTALKYMLERDFQRRGLKANLEISGNPIRMGPLLETVLFRVAQEALTNVLRHAETSEVDLRLEYRPESISLKISDNGSGFDPNEVFVAPRGWGLGGMKERAESVGGKMQIKSSPNRGTTVEVEIPIPPEQGD
ncbi:MAG TPA: sensor histidine kinase [Anaerolineales bacterium]|nr:sensor histidine kinase [Anaerolineales bacterium]